MLSKTPVPHLSKQVRDLKASPTLAINELSKELIQRGEKVYKLGFGQSPFPVPPIVVEALQRHAAEKDYLPVAGLPALREQIAIAKSQSLQMKIEADQVIIGPGSKELIFGLQMAFEGEVLLPSPTWVSYGPQAQIAGKSMRWIDCSYEDQWKLLPEALAKACEIHTDQAKLLILNYPSNPTGATYSAEELRALAEVCKKYQVLVCADEIYGETHFQGSHKSLAAYYPEGTIISGGLSKWCGAGGWRLGSFIFPRNYRWLQEALLKIASETYSAVSAPIQYAAITAYSEHPSLKTYLKHSRLILNWVSDYVNEELSSSGVKSHPAQGAFYQFPDFEIYQEALARQGIQGSRDFCKALLMETGVALLPGADFGRPESELSARLSFVDFNGEQALQALQEGASTIKDRKKFLQTYCPQIYESIPKMIHWLKEQ